MTLRMATVIVCLLDAAVWALVAFAMLNSGSDLAAKTTAGFVGQCGATAVTAATLRSSGISSVAIMKATVIA